MKASELKDHKKLVNLHYMTRDSVVPFYKDLIARQAPDTEVKRINDLILSKWKPSGLIYIKERAWKGELMLNWTNGIQTVITDDESCPNCLSSDIIMFTSDLDMCQRCGQTF